MEAPLSVLLDSLAADIVGSSLTVARVGS